MKRVFLFAVACGMLASCESSKRPMYVVLNMSEDERPFELVVDAIENDTIYVSPSVFEDTTKTISQ
jgi:hypothetical protein